METPPSGMPSPPLSPHGTPSSLASDFPSLSSSLYDVFPPDSPCPTNSDHHHQDYLHGFDHPEALSHLILPSLALSRTASIANFHGPPILPTRPPSALGNVRLLVLGRHGAGKTLLCESLVQGMGQPVEVHGWNHEEGVGRVLTAATDERSHANVSIARLDGWDDSEDPQRVLDNILNVIHTPFKDLDGVLRPGSGELSLNLLSSAATPLYTAAIVVLSPSPSPVESMLLRALSQHLPTIPFSLHPHPPLRHHRRARSPDVSRPQSRHRPSRPHSRHRQNLYSRQTSPHHRVPSRLHSRAPSIPEDNGHHHDDPTTRTITAPTATLQPVSHHALREWVFEARNLEKLRREGAEKFLKWREREQKVDAYLPTPTFPAFMGPMHGGQMLPISPEAFERFTFDLLFSESDFGETDEERYTDVEDTTPQEEEPPTFTKAVEEDDRAWEADLSRMVALRKQEMSSRMDTIRGSAVRQPLPPSLLTAPPSDVEVDSDVYYSGNEANEFATSSELIDLDPLYFPSLLSLVRSIIPELKTRLVKRVLWVFPGTGAMKLPTHADDLERRIIVAAGTGISLPLAGVLCAIAATAGFWAGLAVRTDGFVRA